MSRQDEIEAIVSRETERARAAERRRIGLWLEQQATVAREAPSGVHPGAGVRTQAAGFIWAAARVLAEDL